MQAVDQHENNIGLASHPSKHNFDPMLAWCWASAQRLGLDPY